MTKRNWQEANLDLAFFRVKENPVGWIDAHNNTHVIGNYRALMNSEDNHVFSVVTDKYNLITNEEAYLYADLVVRGVFEGHTLSEFKCFNLYMPKTKGSCRIDLIIPNSEYKAFDDKSECFTPFIRISNSYNKTLTLKYEIGFCRWICLNGVIFGQKGVTFSIPHYERIGALEIDGWIKIAKKNIGGIGNLWTAFENKLKKLREIEMPESMAVPMFMKAFGTKIDKDALKIWENYESKVLRIRDLAKEYFNDLGDNAYAMFNVLTDFASFPDSNTGSNYLTPGYQRRVGNWADEIITAHEKEDFTITSFIGTEIIASSMFLQKHLEVMKGSR